MYHHNSSPTNCQRDPEAHSPKLELYKDHSLTVIEILIQSSPTCLEWLVTTDQRPRGMLEDWDYTLLVASHCLQWAHFALAKERIEHGGSGVCDANIPQIWGALSLLGGEMQHAPTLIISSILSFPYTHLLSSFCLSPWGRKVVCSIYVRFTK